MSRMGDLHAELTEKLGREPNDDDLKAYVAERKTYTNAEIEDELQLAATLVQIGGPFFASNLIVLSSIAKQLRRERNEQKSRADKFLAQIAELEEQGIVERRLTDQRVEEVYDLKSRLVLAVALAKSSEQDAKDLAARPICTECRATPLDETRCTGCIERDEQDDDADHAERDAFFRGPR